MIGCFKSFLVIELNDRFKNSMQLNSNDQSYDEGVFKSMFIVCLLSWPLSWVYVVYLLLKHYKFKYGK